TLFRSETLHPLFIKDSSVDLGKIHKTHKSEIRLAISGDVYVEELKNDEIDFNLLEDVCGSVGIIIPKRVYDLKEKVEAGLYKRGFVKANKEFLSSIKESLTPYINKLKDIKRIHIMGNIEKYEESGYTTLYKYINSKGDK